MSDVIRVLIVDDAPFMRRSLRGLLKDADGIEVVGEAVNGLEGVSRFLALRPDVVCLDVDMPEMDGITALKHIMSTRPTPVIIVSSLTDRDDVPFEAVRLGAMEFFPKPSSLSGSLADQTQYLLYLLRNARRVRTENLRRVPLTPRRAGAAPTPACRHVLAIGGSLGSTSALIRMLSLLPPGGEAEVAILCQVPLHPAIRGSFADSVRNLLGWSVAEEAGDQALRAGTLYFVPHGHAASFDRQPLSFEACSQTCLDDTFRAVARRFREHATLVLLAGDRSSGVSGLAAAAEEGSECFVQDEQSALFANWDPEPGTAIVLKNVDAIVDVVRERLSRAPRLAVGS